MDNPDHSFGAFLIGIFFSTVVLGVIFVAVSIEDLKNRDKEWQERLIKAKLAEYYIDDKSEKAFRIFAESKLEK